MRGGTYFWQALKRTARQLLAITPVSEVLRDREGYLSSNPGGYMQSDAAPQKNHAHLADDILEGAEAIADFLFCGTSDHERGRNRRKVYYLAENCQLHSSGSVRSFAYASRCCSISLPRRKFACCPRGNIAAGEDMGAQVLRTITSRGRHRARLSDNE